METPIPSYRCHRYTAEIIAQCVRLYYRFRLSYRGVEELLFERGVIVSYESIRRWCHTFGPIYAAEIRRRRPHPKEKWHMGEVFIKMGGRTSYLGRAMDAGGMVLDILVQERRNQEAAEAFLRRLVEGYYHTACRGRVRVHRLWRRGGVVLSWHRLEDVTFDDLNQGDRVGFEIEIHAKRHGDRAVHVRRLDAPPR